MRRFLSLVIGVSLLLGFVSPVSAYYTNMSASVVVGQTDFTSNSSTTSATSLSNPIGSFSDGKRLFVADINNARVLIWNSIPTQNGTPADVVLGQPDFTSKTVNNGGISARTLNTPTHIFSDGTHLVVVDGQATKNNRVLIWNSIPTTNFQPADVVVGQPDFTTTSSALTPSKFSGAFATSIYNGKLIVSDTNGRRVLIFNSIPTTNGTSADVVVGQDNFTSNGSGTTANRFITNARALAVKNNKLIVEDAHRFMIWNSLPTTNGASADIVLGQPDFTTNTQDNGGISCASLNSPDGVTITDSGRLIVSDTGRVLIWNTFPTANFQSANIVLGQPDCNTRTHNYGGISASSLAVTGGNIRVFTVNNQLFVSDSPNNRLLIFTNIISTPELTLSGVEKLSDNRLKISGNVKLGEAGHYDLGGGGGISFSINGSDGVGVNSIGNEVSDGNGSKFWEFSNTFEPWTGGNGLKEEWERNFDYMRSTLGFSVKVTSRSSNTDSSKAFYFEPFKLVSFTPTSLKFSVSGQNPWYQEKQKDQLQRIKDNIDHFEVWVKRPPTVPYSIKSGENWIKYFDKISTEKISSTGEVSLTNLTPLTKLTQGSYQVKVVSVSKESNLGEDSNTLTYTPRRIVPRTPTPTVQEIKTEVVQTPTPEPQPTPQPTPIPQNKSCFLWWCW